jgi:serine/threonine protein kinase
MFRIVEDDGPPVPEGLSDPLIAFLKECHHKDPAWRPRAKELSQHGWLDQSLNRVQPLTHNPEVAGYELIPCAFTAPASSK